MTDDEMPNMHGVPTDLVDFLRDTDKGRANQRAKESRERVAARERALEKDIAKVWSRGERTPASRRSLEVMARGRQHDKITAEAARAAVLNRWAAYLGELHLVAQRETAPDTSGAGAGAVGVNLAALAARGPRSLHDMRGELAELYRTRVEALNRLRDFELSTHRAQGEAGEE